MNLTRKLVYELLWTYPATRVAAALGISSSSLAKTCDRRGIPTPGRGHWQRLGSGADIPIPTLVPVEFELPLPWTTTPEIEVLLQRSTASASAGGNPSGAAAGPPAQRPLVAEDPIPLPSPPPSPSAKERPLLPRSGPEAKVVTGVAPKDAAALAALAREIDACEQFCDEVLRVAKKQPLAIGEVMEAWVYTVRRSSRVRDPVAALVQQCTKIAQESMPIPWREPETGSKGGS